MSMNLLLFILWSNCRGAIQLSAFLLCIYSKRMPPPSSVLKMLHWKRFQRKLIRWQYTMWLSINGSPFSHLCPMVLSDQGMRAYPLNSYVWFSVCKHGWKPFAIKGPHSSPLYFAFFLSGLIQHFCLFWKNSWLLEKVKW